MAEYHFELPIRDKTALKLFLRHAFGLSIPDVAVCPGHVSPWQAFCDAYFARHRVSVWLASRGFGGKSFLLAMLGLVEAATLTTIGAARGTRGSAGRAAVIDPRWRCRTVIRGCERAGN